MKLPESGEFCWNELACRDVKKAKDFYGKMFGWTFTDLPMGDSTYTVFKKGNDNFGGIWSIPNDQKEIPPHWMSYIFVEDVQAYLLKAKANGATIIKEATPAGDMGTLGILQDPTGAYVALWQPA